MNNLPSTYSIIQSFNFNHLYYVFSLHDPYSVSALLWSTPPELVLFLMSINYTLVPWPLYLTSDKLSFEHFHYFLNPSWQGTYIHWLPRTESLSFIFLAHIVLRCQKGVTWHYHLLGLQGWFVLSVYSRSLSLVGSSIVQQFRGSQIETTNYCAFFCPGNSLIHW